MTSPIPPIPADWSSGDTPTPDEMNAVLANLRTYFTPAFLSLSGLRSATLDPSSLASTVALAQQNVFLARFPWPGGTINTLYYHISVAGASLTTNQSLMGIYSGAGVKLAETLPQHGNWTFSGRMATNLTAPLIAPAGTYWVATMSNGTTRPTFWIGGSGMTIGPEIRSGFLTAGGFTALPSVFDPANDLTRYNAIGIGIA